MLAHRLLTKVNITNCVREFLDIFISDEVVDKELGQVILQYGDLSAKVAAIREYNKVKNRVITTIKFTDNHGELTDEEIQAEIDKRNINGKS